MKLVLINPRNRVSLYGDYGWEPLSLGYVAACTPPGWEVELIDEQCEGMLDYRQVEADLVGITAFTTQAPRAYRIAAEFRSRRIPVVMGGIHASLVPDEAARYTDAIFIGECERTWPQVIADVEAGALKPVYDGGTTGSDLARTRSASLRQVSLRVRLRADLARLSDGLFVLLGDGLQRQAVPDARRGRGRRRGRPRSRPATSSSWTTT